MRVVFVTHDGVRIRYAESRREDYLHSYDGELDNAQLLDERLPRSTLVMLDSAYFVREEQAAEHASIGAGRMTDGYRNALTDLGRSR